MIYDLFEANSKLVSQNDFLCGNDMCKISLSSGSDISHDDNNMLSSSEVETKLPRCVAVVDDEEALFN